VTPETRWAKSWLGQGPQTHKTREPWKNRSRSAGAATTHENQTGEAGARLRAARAGRESRFALDPRPIVDAQTYLEHVSRQWDNALARLKALVEEQ